MSTVALATSELEPVNWQLTNDDKHKPLALVVQQASYAHVLPYGCFLYAEGDDNLVRITFTSHRVVVTGHGLVALLAAVAAQRIVRLIQPTDHKRNSGVPTRKVVLSRRSSITCIAVEKLT